jgi:hypothetical protein
MKTILDMYLWAHLSQNQRISHSSNILTKKNMNWTESITTKKRNRIKLKQNSNMALKTEIIKNTKENYKP